MAHRPSRYRARPYPWLIGLALVLSLFPSRVDAQLSATVDYASAYLFAGVPFAARGEGAVSRATLSYDVGNGISVNGFGVWDYNTDQIIEADLYVELNRQLAPRVGYFAGAVFYNFLIGDEWQSTYELYGGLSLDAPLSPRLLVAHDLEAGADGLGDGTRANLQISERFLFSASAPALTLASSVEYNADYYTESSGFAYADFVVALDIPLGPVTLVPAITIQRQLDDAFTGFIDDQEVFSLAAMFGF